MEFIIIILIIVIIILLTYLFLYHNEVKHISKEIDNIKDLDSNTLIHSKYNLKNINFDDLKANDGYDLEYQLYIANHCDVRVHISAIDGRIFIEERDEDNNMTEYSLFELSQRNKS